MEHEGEKANRAGTNRLIKATATSNMATAAHFGFVSCFALKGIHTTIKRSIVTATMHIALREGPSEIKNCLMLQLFNGHGYGRCRTGTTQNLSVHITKHRQSAQVRTDRYSPVEVVRIALAWITIKLSVFATKPVARIMGNPYFAISFL